MEIVAIVTALALLEYGWIAMRVGQARGQYGVQAPATTGHEVFERWFRVQQNTLEQLVMFLPALWMFATYVGPRLGALVGLVFIVGRFVYARAYVADPASRSQGFAIGFVANAVLLAGALLGALWRWI